MSTTEQGGSEMATVLASHGQPAFGLRTNGTGESPDAHCIVATRSEDFLFSICFELETISNARVTGCLSLFQAWQVAGAEVPRLAVVDSVLVNEDPDGVLTLASCMAVPSTLVVLTDSPVVEMWSRWGSTRLVYRQLPESPGRLSVFLERLLGGGAPDPGEEPRTVLMPRLQRLAAV